MKLPFSPSALSARNIRVEQRCNRLFSAPLPPPWRRQYSTPASQTTTTPPQTATPAPESNTPSLPDQVRLLMRRVPYPVAIITATDPHGPADKAFRGMTVSSFNTVTLRPEPIISFNVRRPSETLSALQSSGRFLVHLLSPGPATAALARDFSRGNQNLALLSGEGEFEFAEHVVADGLDARPLPILRRRQAANAVDDFPFVLECRLNPQRVEVYDHTIVVGTVVQVLSRHLHGSDVEGPDTAHSAKDLCLTYANTRFWEMGHEI